MREFWGQGRGVHTMIDGSQDQAKACGDAGGEVWAAVGTGVGTAERIAVRVGATFRIVSHNVLQGSYNWTVVSPVSWGYW